MLCERYSLEFLEQNLLSLADWKPFPPAADRDAWNALLQSPLNRERRAYLTGRAEALLNQPWPEMKASTFMQIERLGNRTNWEKQFFARRINLAILVLAECLEYKDRFLDEIINGIWLITEEATWALNAHAYRAPHRDGQDPLPFQGDETLALFSLQTAASLAEILYLLKDKLESISPALCTRIRNELNRRVIDQFENDTDEPLAQSTRRVTPWMDGHNNWTPWCCANLTGTLMYQIDDPKRLAPLVMRCMKGIDRFIDVYGADGGCDEGPGYWNVAGGAMLRFLEWLYSRTDGKVTIYDEPLIKEMGLYISRVHLAGKWFANFADASAKAGVQQGVTWRYGERVKAPAMQALVHEQMLDSDGEIRPLIKPYALPIMLRDLWWIPGELPEITAEKEPESWFPDLEVLVSRGTDSEGNGLILAAKAGHNKENHNHNDVGQFIIMLDGEPVIVDPGTEAYTKATFSGQRYGLWTHRSSGHNVPLVNGKEQQPGEAFKAENVFYSSKEEERTLGMNLESAFAQDAGIVYLRREITHRPDEQIIRITDKAEVEDSPLQIMVPLYTIAEPQEPEPGIILLGSGERKLKLKYDYTTINVDIIPRHITDAKLVREWGDILFRVELKYRGKDKAGRLEMVFEPQ